MPARKEARKPVLVSVKDESQLSDFGTLALSQYNPSHRIVVGKTGGRNIKYVRHFELYIKKAGLIIISDMAF